MMTSDDKVGGWVKKGQNHDDVILECSLTFLQSIVVHKLSIAMQMKKRYCYKKTLLSDLLTRRWSTAL